MEAGERMLSGMKFDGPELVGLLVAVSFAAGLNVYATVATLGILAHLGVLALCTRGCICSPVGR